VRVTVVTAAITPKLISGNEHAAVKETDVHEVMHAFLVHRIADRDAGVPGLRARGCRRRGNLFGIQNQVPRGPTKRHVIVTNVIWAGKVMDGTIRIRDALSLKTNTAGVSTLIKAAKTA
jgi:hypothetical protein